MKILVLGGGISPEREVSLRSANAVAGAAREAGFEVEQADPQDGLAILDEIGRDTVVFPILHGAGGEDGVIQTELEKRHLPYLGSDSTASANCFDKWKTLEIFLKADIPIARSALVTKETFINHELTQKPYVLKVVHGGSSIGVLIARDPRLILPEQIDEIFKMESPAILEELVEGTEITVPVLDKAALPVIEIRAPKGEEFDYDNKYNGASAEICPPKFVSKDVQLEAQRLAEKCHEALKCRHLSRTDMMVRPDGSLVVFDINTMPGLADQSLYPKSANVARINMPELVKRFVGMVVRDTKNHKRGLILAA